MLLIYNRFALGVNLKLTYFKPHMDATYDSRTDVLAVRTRKGEPKYVVVGRGTFVIFADDKGIWGIDLEAESWDQDVDDIFKKMKIEILKNANLDTLDRLSRLMPPRRMTPWPYIPAEWQHSS
jgi:hypothetical protein